MQDPVTGVARNKAGLELLVGGRLNVWIADPDVVRFTANPAKLKGRHVLVRGWLR